jgi:hypothetical protein
VFLVASAAAILMVSCASTAQRPSQTQENALIDAAKRAATNDDLLGLQALESKALAVGDADAERQGSRLVLHSRSGATKIYKNGPECKIPSLESECQTYTLVAHASSRGVFVVAKLYYESVEYLLVDDVTGDETTLRAFPVFSPSGNHVLVLLMNDNEVGFAVQIWRREGHRFVLDWSGSPHTEGSYTSYELVGWPVENRIRLRSETDFESEKPTLKKYFELHLSGHRWNLVETP